VTTDRAQIRVLLADDHETVRHGLRLLLDGQQDIAVVGEAADGAAAVRAAGILEPDIAILDLSMPGMNGLTAARTIRETLPRVAIIALTRHDDEAYLKELLRAGVSGYVLKQSPSSELLEAIRAVAAGREHLDRALSSQWVSPACPRPDTAPPNLTDREAEVLRLLAWGHSNKEVAAQLDLSVKTVEVHKANASRKMGFRGRIDIVRYALLRGWLQED
jgi:DNA-binding NarL/FixJ family response regulator